MNFTKLMGNVYSELDLEFENLHTDEELKQYFNELESKIKFNRENGNEILDSSVIDVYNKIFRILKNCVQEFQIPEKYDLVKIRRTAQAKTLKLKRTDSDYYEKLKMINDDMETGIKECCNFISKYISTFPSKEELDNTFMEKIADKYLGKVAPSSADYIKRIVHRRLKKISPEFVCVRGGLGDKTDSENFVVDEANERILREDLPSVRLLILKQFIKVFGWGKGVADIDESRRNLPIQSPELKEYIEKKYEGSEKEAAIGIDESIFIQSKKFKHRGLFIIAERLAEGKFTNSQIVREDVYIFSIAFHMTFSSDLRSNITENDEDYETDIRKNLFFDYYCENLFNYDLNKKSSGRKSDNNGDAERSNRKKYIPGYGPNYRNFVEMIYIYFIGKDNLTELEKLQGAKKMIKECQKQGKAIEDFDEWDDDDALTFQPTEYYRTTVFNEVKDKNCDEFKNYILKNFICRVENEIIFEKEKEIEIEIERTISRMNVRAAHITSAEIYSQVLLLFKQEQDKRKSGQEKIIIKYTGSDNRLREILEKFNDLCENEGVLRRWYLNLDNAYGFSQLRKGMVEYDDNIVVNRTDLEVLLADFLSVKILQETYEREKEILSNFKSFYDYVSKEFKISVFGSTYLGISSLLSVCGYQEICSKNVFDIMLIYLTYKKCVYNVFKGGI